LPGLEVQAHGARFRTFDLPFSYQGHAFYRHEVLWPQPWLLPAAPDIVDLHRLPEYTCQSQGGPQYLPSTLAVATINLKHHHFCTLNGDNILPNPKYEARNTKQRNLGILELRD
jgi:hypothetical protein